MLYLVALAALTAGCVVATRAAGAWGSTLVSAGPTLYRDSARGVREARPTPLWVRGVAFAGAAWSVCMGSLSVVGGVMALYALEYQSMCSVATLLGIALAFLVLGLRQLRASWHLVGGVRLDEVRDWALWSFGLHLALPVLAVFVWPPTDLARFVVVSVVGQAVALAMLSTRRWAEQLRWSLSA
ncbi:MAG: hypothetical protein AAGE52_32405 [Myxococcota bacterium]